MVVVSERRVVAKQTEGEEEQQDSGDYKLRGETDAVTLFSPFIA